MITDRQLAEACQATYVGAPQTWGTDCVHAFLSQVDDVQIIAFEGTQSPQEWVIDILGAFPADTKLDHDTLGVVHAGWYRDVCFIRDAILDYMMSTKYGTRFAITGHSKGAAEALIFAAECVANGLSIERVTTFGTPHPGDLNGYLAHIPGADYRNNDDPVWDVPPFLPHPRGRIQKFISIPPMVDDPWGPLASHHMGLYLVGAEG